MTHKLTTFIPAGGRGSRLWPHTHKTPKPLLLMGSSDQRIIDNPLAITTDISSRVWVSIDYLGDQIQEYLHGRKKVSIVRDTKTAGSGGSLLEHYKRFSQLESDGDLLVLPSDHIYQGDFCIKKYLKHHRNSGADVTLLTVPPKDYGEYLRIHKKTPVSIERKPHPSYESTTGTYLFRNKYILEKLRAIKKDRKSELNIYQDIVCPSIGRSRVATHFISEDIGFWEDAGTHRRFLNANMRLSGNKNVIARTATVSKKVRLKRCVVLHDVVLKASMEIQDSIISRDDHGNPLITLVPTQDYHNPYNVSMSAWIFALCPWTPLL